MDSNKKQPLGLAAYATIYRKIMVLEYAPGQRLEEKQLIEELGIGRTPIREALVRLSADFMIDTIPKKGYIVRPLTIQNIKAAFTALKILEAGVAELAVKQDTRRIIALMLNANAAVKAAIKSKNLIDLVESNNTFHHNFAQCSYNEYLIHGLEKVRCETNRLAYLSFGNEIDPLRSLTAHYRSVIDHHEEIIHYIKTRDVIRLKKTLGQHNQIFSKPDHHVYGKLTLEVISIRSFGPATELAEHFKSQIRRQYYEKTICAFFNRDLCFGINLNWLCQNEMGLSLELSGR